MALQMMTFENDMGQMIWGTINSLCPILRAYQMTAVMPADK